MAFYRVKRVYRSIQNSITFTFNH